MSNLKGITTEELLQMYANANATCSCGGHWKGDQNARLRKAYAIELETRGIAVPKGIYDIVNKNFKSNVEIPVGVFNGIGSY